MKSNKTTSIFNLAFTVTAIFFASESFAQTGVNKSKTSGTKNTGNSVTTGETLVCIPMSEWKSTYADLAQK